MRLHVIREIAATTLREHLRTPEALFWTYAFPLLLMIVLGLAFGDKPPAPVLVVIPASETSSALAEAVKSPRVHALVLPAEQASKRLATGESDLLLLGTPAAPVIQIDPERASSERSRLIVQDVLQAHAGRKNPIRIEVQREMRPGKRYIDWLLPGLLGMQLLGAGMWGVGFNLVDIRGKNLLRRLVVTPMRRSEFLLGFMLSRVCLMLVEAVALIAIGMLLFSVPFLGSMTTMLCLLLLGSLAFSGLGILVASRVRTMEAVSGLMNLVLLPMWLLGGIFFNAKRFPDFVQPLVKALPITHLNDSLRAVMLHGEGLASVWPQALILIAFAAGFFALALRLFRWS